MFSIKTRIELTTNLAPEFLIKIKNGINEKKLNNIVGKQN